MAAAQTILFNADEEPMLAYWDYDNLWHKTWSPQKISFHKLNAWRVHDTSSRAAQPLQHLLVNGETVSTSFTASHRSPIKRKKSKMSATVNDEFKDALWPSRLILSHTSIATSIRSSDANNFQQAVIDCCRWRQMKIAFDARPFYRDWQTGCTVARRAVNAQWIART